MYHHRPSSDAASVLATGPGGAQMPPHLLGTRAALFHLLKENTPRASVPGRVFRRSNASMTRPVETPPLPRESAIVEHSPIHRLWRDFLLEDTFDFMKPATS